MNVNAWTNSFSNALSSFWTKIASFLPNLIATIIVVVVGFYISKLVSKWIAKIIEKVGFDSLCDKLNLTKSLKAIGFSSSPSKIVGLILHVFFTLIILVAAADMLALDRLSAILDEFVLYLPKLFGALVITIIGLFIASAGKAQVEKSLDNLGVEYGNAAGRVLQMLVIFITFSLVIGQLELETALLNTIFTVLIASLGIALALALGLGTKSIANSVVSGIYAREQLSPGDEINFKDFVGNVVMVSTVNTLIENKKGEQLSIPNQDLLTQKFTMIKHATKPTKPAKAAKPVKETKPAKAAVKPPKASK